MPSKSLSRSETYTQRNIENKGQKVAVKSRDVVLSLAFVPGSGPASAWDSLPFSRTTAQNGELLNGGRPSPSPPWTPPASPHPPSALVTSNSLCSCLSKGPEGPTPELSHHSNTVSTPRLTLRDKTRTLTLSSINLKQSAKIFKIKTIAYIETLF